MINLIICINFKQYDSLSFRTFKHGPRYSFTQSDIESIVKHDILGMNPQCFLNSNELLVECELDESNSERAMLILHIEKDGDKVGVIKSIKFDAAGIIK